MKKPKKCGECKAYGNPCALGYKTESYRLNEIELNRIPLEPCPKPLTNKELLEELYVHGKIKRP